MWIWLQMVIMLVTPLAAQELETFGDEMVLSDGRMRGYVLVMDSIQDLGSYQLTKKHRTRVTF